MKYVLVLVVVLVVVWLAFGRNLGRGQPRDGGESTPRPKASPQATPQSMVACAHCGVHLPAADALVDAQARRYCSEAHRSAGPR